METQRRRVGEKKGISRQKGGEHEAEREIDGQGENLNTCSEGSEVIFMRKISLYLDLNENSRPDLLTVGCCVFYVQLFSGSYFVMCLPVVLILVPL